jgi:hypothetical protein
MSEAMMPTRSLFIYPGYRSVCVLAAITVETLTTPHSRREDTINKPLPLPLGRSAQRQKTAVNTHELIGLVKRGRLQMQAVRIDARKRTIVEHDDRVCVVREPLECQ